jgi:hypothetical protein
MLTALGMNNLEVPIEWMRKRNLIWFSREDPWLCKLVGGPKACREKVHENTPEIKLFDLIEKDIILPRAPSPFCLLTPVFCSSLFPIPFYLLLHALPFPRSLKPFGLSWVRRLKPSCV